MIKYVETPRQMKKHSETATQKAIIENVEHVKKSINII